MLREQVKPKNLIVNSQRCAGYLMLNGCALLRIEQSKYNPNRNVFVFYDDVKTNQFLKEYTEEVKKQKHETKNIHQGFNRGQVQRVEE